MFWCSGSYLTRPGRVRDPTGFGLNQIFPNLCDLQHVLVFRVISDPTGSSKGPDRVLLFLLRFGLQLTRPGSRSDPVGFFCSWVFLSSAFLPFSLLQTLSLFYNYEKKEKTITNKIKQVLTN
ncbi:unnamed protein product [Cuscuta europaea]|uniref:Uncharacterized protein n=1 Tax=Cuscuta europaea TaxID=41803 RepID=A0A9P0Z9R0_CUSEU|nr:unnamed protein product [Cuscuta europaea]